MRDYCGVALLVLLAAGCSAGPDERQLVRREMVIFASDRGADAQMNVWMMTPEGENLRQLTHYPWGYRVPVAVSPEGKHILFAHFSDLTEATGLYIMPVDGPAPELGQTLTRGYHPIYSARFFPDGRRLIVENGHSVQVFDLQDSSLVWLRPNESGRAPDISPDGQTICFHRQIEEDTLFARQIMLMDVDGGNLRELTPAEHFVFAESCAFTPDGSKVLYRMLGDIHWIDLSTGEQHRYELFDADFAPAISPSGDRIYFRQRGGLFPEADSEIAVMDFDGSNFRRLTNDNHTDGFVVVGVVEFYE